MNSASKNQATEHRPKHAVTEAENVPLIDLSVESNLVAEIKGRVQEMGVLPSCQPWSFARIAPEYRVGGERVLCTVPRGKREGE